MANEATGCAPEDESVVDDPGSSLLWQVLYLSGIVGVTVLAVMAEDSAWRWAVIPLMALLLVLYLTLGLRILHHQDEYYESSTSLLFTAGVLACFVPVVAISPAATTGLFVIAPLGYMTSGVRVGTAAVGIVLVAPALIRTALGLQDWSDLPLHFVVYALILLFSHWFGSWISRVVAQSEGRATLIAQLRRSQADVTRLSEESGAMAERERLAREIHDTLAQGFTSIITLAQAVESELDADPAAARRHVVLMRETAQENLAEARALVAARTPVHLDAGTLEESLKRIAARLGDELGIDTRAEVSGAPLPLPPPVQVGLLRAAQEALANIRKHAGASSATVALRYTSGSVRLTVRDDGRGFDPDARADGHGLDNIRHRAEQVGGTCEVRSAPGSGTEVMLEIPLVREEVSA